MEKKTIRKIIFIFFVIVAGLFIVQCFFRVKINIEQINNHQKVATIINTDLKYSWNTMGEDLAEINDMILNLNLTDEDMGRLHERASFIYMQKGDTMTYFRYLGYALYYLEKSDEKDYTVNGYLDLANFYLNDYANKLAEEMIEKAMAVEPFEEIQNPQIQSYAYRMLGIMAMRRLDYNDAETYLLTSQRIIDLTDSADFGELYTAINDVWLARVYEETGRLPKCKEKLEKWEDNDMFTQEVYRPIILRDFIIPYYQAKCYYLCAENIKERNNSSQMDTAAREQAVIDYLNEFMHICEENNYEKAELYTLLKIQKEYPTKNESIQNELYRVLDQLYSNLFEQQNISYASAINNVVVDAQQEMDNNLKSTHRSVRRIEYIIMSLIAIAFVILILGILLANSHFDGLTKLLNRKTFNKNLAMVMRGNSPYGIIMIDIDNFKQINDNYGHPEGDVVLWRLGQLIAKETTSDIRGYRYGGEEFVLLVGKAGIAYVEKIAERIRGYMEQQGWDFDPDLTITLSIGTAKGSGNDDVLKQADENLYQSKKTGKNKVTST